MTKFSRSAIMTAAWTIRRTANVDMSTALKSAWALVKATMVAEQDGKECGWNYKVNVNNWVKGGHNRTYVSLRIYTNAWNLKRERTMGYVNNFTGEFVAA